MKWKNFIIAILILFIIILLIIFITQSNKNKTTKTNMNTYSNSEPKESITSKSTKKDLINNIIIEKYAITKDGNFVIKITNNNNEFVYIDGISTIYKDVDGTFLKRVEATNDFIRVPANEYTLIYNSNCTIDGDFSDYSTYEFSYANCKKIKKSKFDVSSIDTGEEIAITIKNNTDTTLSYWEVNVAYYKNGNIVGIETRTFR